MTNRRPKEIADLGGPSNPELAQREAAGRHEACVDGVFDGADAIAFRNGDFQRVVARRETRAPGELES
jgi:hypothetical protein